MLMVKERTNSSQFVTTSELKKVQDMAQRKRSSEAALGSDKDTSPDHRSNQGVKSPTKNLLTEFEKDETLEPNSSVFMDAYTNQTTVSNSAPVAPLPAS